MADERTFRIQWAYGRTDHVTGKLTDAIRHAQETIEAGGDAFQWYDPLLIVDLTTGREYRVPDAVLQLPADEAARAVAAAPGDALTLVDYQGLDTARTAILRHLEGYTDTDLRQEAARIAEVMRKVLAGLDAIRDPRPNQVGPRLDRGQRADLVTARGTLRRIAGGNDADPDTAASMIDRVLAATCRHDPDERHTAPDVTTGRPLTTCSACGVSWYADYPERLEHVTSYAGGEG